MYLYSKSVVFGHGRMARINKYAFLGRYPVILLSSFLESLMQMACMI